MRSCRHYVINELIGEHVNSYSIYEFHVWCLWVQCSAEVFIRAMHVADSSTYTSIRKAPTFSPTIQFTIRNYSTRQHNIVPSFRIHIFLSMLRRASFLLFQEQCLICRAFTKLLPYTETHAYTINIISLNIILNNVYIFLFRFR